jgi:hypothetical protein
MEMYRLTDKDDYNTVYKSTRKKKKLDEELYMSTVLTRFGKKSSETISTK